MFAALLQGMLLGLGLILLIGPVFFTLLHAAIKFNSKAGLTVALGIIVSDIVCVLICYQFSQLLMQFAWFNQLLLGLGFLILLSLGIKYLLLKQIKESTVKIKSATYISLFVQGFLVNFLNPVVFAIWIYFIKIGHQRFDNKGLVLIFLVGILLSIFITDSLKALTAHKLKQFLQKRYLLVVYKAIGLVMIGFAFKLMFDFLSTFSHAI